MVGKELKAVDLEAKLKKLQVSDLEALLRKKKYCAVSYLIVNFRIRDLIEQTRVIVPEDVTKVLMTHLYAYIHDDKMPPASIAGPVLNVAEDLSAGRTVELRAGDYIALQNFARGGH